MELHINQLTFASSFSTQQPSSTVIKSEPIPIKQMASAHHRGDTNNFREKTLEKRERILELQKQIEDSEDEFLNQKQDEEEFDPNKPEEDLFDVVVPAIGSDIYGLQTENEIEIKQLEVEIAQLEKKR